MNQDPVNVKLSIDRSEFDKDFADMERKLETLNRLQRAKLGDLLLSGLCWAFVMAASSAFGIYMGYLILMARGLKP